VAEVAQLMSNVSAAEPPDGVVLSMLRTILNQNSQILSQNAEMNARLVEVEKVQQRLQQPMRSRPRSKCSDGFQWKCPVCSQQLKHLDSFVSHIRKLAVHTNRRFAQQKESTARCCFDLVNPDHLQLVVKFNGVNNAEKSISFSQHLLFFCRTTSASRFSVADKHSRITDWLQRSLNDPSFVIPGDCPCVSDMSSSGSGGVFVSSGSDPGHHVQLRAAGVSKQRL
jgi:hypothetical protein